jgi:hypothetical protein
MVSCCGQPVFKRSATSSVGESHSPLEITPHKAGVVGDGLITASSALIAMSTQRRCSAACNSVEHFELRPSQRCAVAFDESGSCLVNDVSHLPGWPFHA